VEKIQFADGTTWDESILRERARGHDLSSWWHQDWDKEGHRGEHGRFSWLDRKTISDAGDDEEISASRDSRQAIAGWLAREARFDFNAIGTHMRRDGERHHESIARERIANQWRAIRIAASLLDYSDDGVSINSKPLALGAVYTLYGHGWGYASSTGQQTAYGGMEALSGLCEGFEKLG
jgi:hypothetical protein